jgi:hypothetical protein
MTWNWWYWWHGWRRFEHPEQEATVADLMEDDLTEKVEKIQKNYALRLNSRAIQVISPKVSETDPASNHGPFLTLKVDLSKSKTQIRYEFFELLSKYWQGSIE